MHLVHALGRWSAAALLCIVAPIIAAGQTPTLVPVATIGCETCDGPAQLTTIYDVVVRANGDVLVSDASAPMLRSFARDGRVLWSAGRRGEGPAEFLYPMRIALLPQGDVRVLDLRTRRVTHLGRDGVERASARLTRFPGDAARIGETGEMLVLMDDFRSDYEIERWVPGRSEGEVIARFPRPARPPGEPHVPPALAVSPTGEVAVVVLPVQYRILRFIRSIKIGGRVRYRASDVRLYIATQGERRRC